MINKVNKNKVFKINKDLYKACNLGSSLLCTYTHSQLYKDAVKYQRWTLIKQAVMLLIYDIKDTQPLKKSLSGYNLFTLILLFYYFPAHAVHLRFYPCVCVLLFSPGETGTRRV